MTTDFTKDPVPRRWNGGCLLAIFVAFAIAAGVLSYSTARFRGDFSGRTEAQVLARLGPPSESARRPDSDELSLVWTYGWGAGLVLEFKRGVVVNQLSVSR